VSVEAVTHPPAMDDAMAVWRELLKTKIARS
jgi:hypothetical protein